MESIIELEFFLSPRDFSSKKKIFRSIIKKDFFNFKTCNFLIILSIDIFLFIYGINNIFVRFKRKKLMDI